MRTRRRILVVEDQAPWLRQYARALEEEGFEFDMTDTRDGALTLLQNKSFDAAVIDLQLRDDVSHKGGIDVLEYIAKCNEGTRAFAVSATPDVRDSVQSSRIGITDFVMKDEMEAPADIVPRLKSALKDYKPVLIGPSGSLTAYLSAPEGEVFWERSVRDTVGCTYQSFVEGLNGGLGTFLPILRRRDGSVSFTLDGSKHAIFGVFWSKGIGAPIWISAYGRNGEAMPPKEEGAGDPEREGFYSGFNIKVWRLSKPARNEFVEFIWDTPWRTEADKSSRKGGKGQAPWF